MAKVVVRNADQAQAADNGVLEYYGQGHPIHLHAHTLELGQELSIEASLIDRMAYVLSGAVNVNGQDLPAGSATIVERGASAVVVGSGADTKVLVFAGAASSGQPKTGGHVHLLPSERVPTVARMSASGVSGALFADAQCPTCEVWLHENRFPAGLAPPADPRAGVHSHDEDEIIFVTDGQMQLGGKLVGPGTAIAIAADTLYSFQPGPDGLTFVNFRSGRPGLIRFADGRTADEVAVWSAVDRPLAYLTV